MPNPCPMSAAQHGLSLLQVDAPGEPWIRLSIPLSKGLIKVQTKPSQRKGALKKNRLRQQGLGLTAAWGKVSKPKIGTAKPGGAGTATTEWILSHQAQDLPKGRGSSSFPVCYPCLHIFN